MQKKHGKKRKTKMREGEMICASGVDLLPEKNVDFSHAL
jgi:hypothetical protein